MWSKYTEKNNISYSNLALLTSFLSNTVGKSVSSGSHCDSTFGLH